MSHHSITRFRLSSKVAWNTLAEAFSALTEALGGGAGLMGMRVVDLGERAGMVLAEFESPEACELASRDTIGPWVAKHLAPHLDGPPEHLQGTGVFEFLGARAREMQAVAPDSRADVLGEFMETVVQHGVVWGLYGETWARAVGLEGLEGVEALPFWPSVEAAAQSVRGEWAEFVPRKIALTEFVEQWLDGMVEDGIAVVVHPTATRAGIVVDPAKLASALGALTSV